MNRKLHRLAALLLTLTLPTFASAAELEIGQAAPPLQIDTWVKGEPVDLSASRGKNIVVVEFWATWCGPCIQSIPHLTKLQREFRDKGVLFAGLTNEDPENTLDMVKELVSKQGSAMEYAVGFEKEPRTYNAYMEATGSMGIPTAFIVDREGRLAWIGHPMNGMEEILKELVAGKFDIVLSKKLYDLDKKLWEAVQTDDAKATLAVADEMIALKPKHADAWQMKLRTLASADPAAPAVAAAGGKSELVAAAGKALELFAGDAEALASISRTLSDAADQPEAQSLGLKAAEQAVAADGKSPAARIALFTSLAKSKQDEKAMKWAAESIKALEGDAKGLSWFASFLSSPDHGDKCSALAVEAVNLAIKAEPEEARHIRTKFRIVATCQKDEKAAEQVGSYFIEKSAGNAMLLNDFAWALLTEKPYEGRYDALALRAAERCHEVSGGSNWMFVDTLALAKFENGAIADAVTLQKKAIELCDNENYKVALKEQLAKFEAAAGTGKADESTRQTAPAGDATSPSEAPKADAPRP